VHRVLCTVYHTVYLTRTSHSTLLYSILYVSLSPTGNTYKNKDDDDDDNEEEEEEA
jgi:hypothetical protein